MHKTHSLSFLSFVAASAAIVAIVAIVFAQPALAESEKSSSAGQIEAGTQVAVAAASARLPVYRPPSVGKPARTVGGGSRGPGDGFTELYVLVPDHVGQTVAEQPSLFWYVDKVPATPVTVEFSLLDEGGIDPLVQATLDPLARPGIHRVELSKYDVKLQSGMEYEWSISLVPDAKSRDKDIVSTGWIDRVDPPSGMDTALASGGEEARAFVFAENGLWYDALSALDQRIEREPGNKDLVKMRADLLRQVGLEGVAASSGL